MTFVTHLASAARQQAGDVTFHHRAAIAAGTGQLHLVRGPLTVQSRLGEDSADLLSTGIGGNGLAALGNAHRENPSRMERLTQGGVIDAKVPRD